MMIIKLKGGLGNQMFQYAAGRNLAVKHGVGIALDHSYLEQNTISRAGFTPRAFELDIFNITAARYHPGLIDEYFHSGNDRFFFYKERPVSYDRTFADIPAFTYMSGYFQSYRYFDSISKIIKDDLSFKENDLFEFNSGLIDLIHRTNSVSIHIRRGDYVDLSVTNSLYTLCDLKYYLRAIAFIVEHHTNPTFFVFSDDIQWVRENLLPVNATMNFIDPTPHANWFDLYLMSICKHNIIANSTFSWWAAWLNKYELKTTIRPRKWFQNYRTGINVHDLCPKQWTII